MKFLKVTALAAVCALSFQVSAFATFNDMPDGEIGEALQAAVDNQLINGIDENTIAPNDPITRAQMATIITRAFGAVNESEITFPDVSNDAWYNSSVKKAVAMSAFQGDEKGNFNPENHITFQETYTVLSRVFYLNPFQFTRSDGTVGTLYETDEASLNAFSDKDNVAQWAKQYVQSIVANGGWTGIDGKLKPTEEITRGEFALIMHKIVTTYIDEPGTYDNLPNGLTIVRVGGVEIKDYTSDKNLILSYGIDEDGCKLTDVNMSAATIVLGGANPVEVTDSQTGETKTTVGDKAYIVISGSFNDVRAKAPYISIDGSAASITHYWGDKYTLLFSGFIS